MIRRKGVYSGDDFVGAVLAPDECARHLDRCRMIVVGLRQPVNHPPHRLGGYTVGIGVWCN